MRYQKELSIAAITAVILLMVFKPSVLGIVYNNVLGKLFLVACIVFLTLKHTIAGLLGVVFIAVIASNSIFEGIDGTADGDSAATGDKGDDKEAMEKVKESTEKDKEKDKEEKPAEPTSQVDIASAALKALTK